MPSSVAIILSAGGLRSLVAAARVALQPDIGKVILVHQRDRSVTTNEKIDYVRRQARHYKFAVLELPPAGMGISGHPGTGQPVRLPKTQLLLTSVALALEYDAASVVWPVQFNGRFEAIALATEQMILTQQLAQIEEHPLPVIHTPLIELTDRQLIELGAHLQVPWHLAWSCSLHGLQPCRQCPTCRQRRTAFEAAGVYDPVEQVSTPV